MHHKKATPKPRAVIGTPWWIRQAIYVIVAITGLILTFLGITDSVQVDSWLSQVGSLAAIIGGLVAAANTGKESDEKPVGVKIPVIVPSEVVVEVPESTPAKDVFSVYHDKE